MAAGEYPAAFSFEKHEPETTDITRSHKVTMEKQGVILTYIYFNMDDANSTKKDFFVSSWLCVSQELSLV